MAQDRDRRFPEVRLGEAQEYYAHAIRTQNEPARLKAEEALSAAKEAVATKQGLSEGARANLEDQIHALRTRLAQYAEVSEKTSIEPAHALPAQGGLDVTTLAAATAFEVGETAESAVLIEIGRRAVAEEARARLEELGTQFAAEMAEAETLLATAEVELEVATQRVATLLSESASDARVSDRLPGIASRFLALLAVVASAGQILLAQASFEGTLPVTQAANFLLAIGYVLTLGGLSGLVGGWLASPSRLPLLQRAPVALLLCATPFFIANTTVDGFRAFGTRLAAGYSAASTVFAIVGVLFVALCLAVGYQVRESYISRRRFADALTDRRHRAYEQRASMRIRRLAVLRSYVARGEALRAEGLRMDALFVHETLRRLPHLGDDITTDDTDLLWPRWMNEALEELARERPSRTEAGYPRATWPTEASAHD